MNGSDSVSESVLVRLDAELAREVVAVSKAREVRFAPSLRGVDLAAGAAILIATAGSADQILTLIVARDHLGDFARRLVVALRQRAHDQHDVGSQESGNLTVHVRSPTESLSIDLRTADPDRVADALRALATVVEAARPQPAD